MKTLTINVKIMKIGSNYIAATSLGGINVRGARGASEIEAVRRLLFKISDLNDDDTSVGLELELDGTTFEAEMNGDTGLTALTDGS